MKQRSQVFGTHTGFVVQGRLLRRGQAPYYTFQQSSNTNLQCKKSRLAGTYINSAITTTELHH
jgi:hypothetical protein